MTNLSLKREEIRVAGKTFRVPSAQIHGRTVVVTGRWIRTAQIKDEGVVEGILVQDPYHFVAELRQSELQADVFTFAQRPSDNTPKYDYHSESDNWAVIQTASYKEWWQNLPQVSRKNVGRSARRDRKSTRL